MINYVTTNNKRVYYITIHWYEEVSMNLLDVIYNRLSYRCRRQRMISSFNQKVEKYKSMSDNEIMMEYIETKTGYLQKKLTLAVISTTILLLVVMDARSSFCGNLFLLFTQPNPNVEVAKAIISIVTIMGTIVLIIYLSLDLKKITKHKIFLEEITEMRYTTNKRRSVPVTGTN